MPGAKCPAKIEEQALAGNSQKIDPYGPPLSPPPRANGHVLFRFFFIHQGRLRPVTADADETLHFLMLSQMYFSKVVPAVLSM